MMQAQVFILACITVLKHSYNKKKYSGTKETTSSAIYLISWPGSTFSDNAPSTSYSCQDWLLGYSIYGNSIIQRYHKYQQMKHTKSKFK
jgi:hypothetical protein